MTQSRRALLCGAVLIALCLALAQPAAAGSRRARNLYEQARTAEVAGEFDRALELYNAASNEVPRDNRYQLAVRRMRFVAGQAHIDTGRKLRAEGLYEEALREFEAAGAIDPASSVALQERSWTLEMIDKRERGATDGLPPEALESALEAERYLRSQRVGTITQPPELAPLSDQPFNLVLNEQAKVVFETIGKLAGINVLFDPDFSDREVEIELRNATLYEALDYVALLAKAFWKPVTHNAVLVTDDNPNKRREYEDEVVKTVYLTNLSTPQDLSEVSTAIRGLTDIRRMFTVNSMSAIVMRGSRSKVAIAEKIVNDMDKPRPEVIIDVLVLEASKSNERTLGLRPNSSGGKGIVTPFTFTGAAGQAAGEGGAGVPVNRLGTVGLGSWTATLPNFLLSAVLSTSEANLLQSPRVRAVDNQPATLRIGDRFPIATGSFQPSVGGVGVNPLVNTQFTYTEIGVNVDLTPKIHPNRDVSMHVQIEISNVREFVTIGDIDQPVIGQRRIEHDVRVREGEASVIGGLNQSQVFINKDGIPFLADIPVIGKLFSDEEVRRSESEILLVLIPHIVRMPGIEDENVRTIASGTEQTFQLRYEQEGNGRPALPPLESDGLPGSEALPAVAPETTPPEDPGSLAEPGTDAVPPPARAEAQPAPVPADAAPGAQGPRLFLDPSAVEVDVGQSVSVSLMVGDAVDLASMPMRIQYDRERLRLTQVEKGPFLAGDDASDVIFSRSIRHANGLAAVNISRFPGAGGASGEGQLVTLTFEGLAPGPAQLRVTANGPRDGSNAVLQVEPLEIEATVR